jgi:hypothetical protein
MSAKGGAVTRKGPQTGGGLMATVATELNGGFGSTRSASSGEPLAERLLTLAAMVGAAGGALAGAALGTENGAAFPVIWGGFGTMLGSGLTAGMWLLCAGRFVGSEGGRASGAR